MYCIGLTGNIASGKSTVIKCFKELGVETIIADNIARQVTAPGQPALEKIREHFGNEVIDGQGRLKRTVLRKIIFSNEHQRIWLEKLLHPLIRQAILSAINQINTAPYCIIEIPLLKKRDDYPYLKRILLVLANEEISIRRVMQRDQCSREQAEAILAAQPSQQSRLQLADDVIYNHGNIIELEEEVKKLHEYYLTLAEEYNL